MLPASIGSTWDSQWNNGVKMLGIEAQHKRNSDGVLTKIYCAKVKPKSDDVINSYAERDWKITLRAMDLSIKPVKFDEIVTSDGKQYTISRVTEIVKNQTMLGWNCVASG